MQNTRIDCGLVPKSDTMNLLIWIDIQLYAKHQFLCPFMCSWGEFI